MDDTRRHDRSGSADVSRRNDATAATAFGALTLIGLAAALVAIRGHVDDAVVALVLGCGVAIAGQIGGRHAGVAAAIAAALGFNFFHTQPYLSLQIHDADDIWTTATLLLVGLVTGLSSDLAARWRRHARRADDELAALERFIDVAADASDDTAVAAATDEIARLLGLTECRYVPGPVPAGLTVVSRRGALPDNEQLSFVGDGFVLPSGGVALRVAGGGEPLGYLICTPARAEGVPLDRRRAAAAIAGALGITLVAHAGRR